MYNLISSIVTLIPFLNCLSAYDTAACNGDICAIFIDPAIGCLADPTNNPTAVETNYQPYVVNPPISSNDEPDFLAAAINPLTGQIFVLFNVVGASNTVYVGTIDDPASDTAPFVVNRTGDGLTGEVYTSLTFDCEGNAYAITSQYVPKITEIDITTGTVVSVTEVAGTGTCEVFVECRELLGYNFDDDYFIRLSTSQGIQDIPPRLFIRDDIAGPDIQENENGTRIDYNGVCNAGRAITAMTYVGNDVALIYCENEDRVFTLNLSDINNPFVEDTGAGFDLSEGLTNGLFNYNSDGSICKPPSCTSNPTVNPTESPTAPPVTKAPTRAPIINAGGGGSGGGGTGSAESGVAGGTHSGSNANSDDCP